MALTIRQVIRTVSAFGVLALMTASAQAQFQRDDILLNLFNSTQPSLEHLLDDGTHILSASGSGESYEGILLTNNGLLATNSRNPSAVVFFDGSGVEVASFPLTAVQSIPADLDQFQDGVLAVVDQGGDVDLFLEDGTFVASYTHAQMMHPFGCHIDSEDHLWVSDLGSVGSGSGTIFEFDRQGVFQQAIVATNFEPGDLVVDPDGSLWVADRVGGNVWHLDANGVVLSNFDPLVAGAFAGIALHSDGTLYLVGQSSQEIRRYTKEGVFISALPFPTTFDPLFMLLVADGSLGNRYCFGDGSGNSCPCANPGGMGQGCANSTGAGAKLLGLGSLSVAQDAAHFNASGLPPNQPALLFVGMNQVQNGNGAFFGDGLRCAGGGVVRLGVSNTNATGETAWGPGLSAAGGWLGGDTRRFQTWYRDPTNSPCGSGFNLTNGVELMFLP